MPLPPISHFGTLKFNAKVVFVFAIFDLIFGDEDAILPKWFNFWRPY